MGSDRKTQNFFMELLKSNNQQSFTIFAKDGRSFSNMKIVESLGVNIKLKEGNDEVLEAVFSAKGRESFTDFYWIAEGVNPKFPLMPGCVEIDRIET